MVSAVAATASSALAILAGNQPAGSALSFLNSTKVSGTPGILDAIRDALNKDSKLRADFEKFYKKESDFVASNGEHISGDNARHNALVSTIQSNRSAFPPEAFTIRTELDDGASIETTIGSAASMAAATFQADQAKRVADYESAQEAKAVGGSISSETSNAKLVALGKIVDTLTVNSAEQEGNIALTLLTRSADEDPYRQY